MFVNCPERIIPLLVNRNPAQYKLLLFVRVFNSRVKVENIDGGRGGEIGKKFSVFSCRVAASSMKLDFGVAVVIASGTSISGEGI